MAHVRRRAEDGDSREGLGPGGRVEEDVAAVAPGWDEEDGGCVLVREEVGRGGGRGRTAVEHPSSSRG